MSSLSQRTLRRITRSGSIAALNAANIVRLWLRDAYPEEWRADRAQPAPDRERYEHLFSTSAATFSDLITTCPEELHWSLGRVYNGAFQTVDVELYHSIIRRYRPQRIIELGAGHSTNFALAALARNGRGRITCIDPSPYAPVRPEVEHLAKRSEDVDLSLFEALEADDILFIDSSHTTDEARYHVEQILPRLQPGVLVHHHDFLFPYDIPFTPRDEYLEQDLLLEFYETHADTFDVLVGTAHLVATAPWLVRRTVPSYRWAPVVLPASLWARRTA